MCIDEAKPVFTGRAGDIFGQMGPGTSSVRWDGARQGTTPPLAMGRRDRQSDILADIPILYRGDLTPECTNSLSGW